MHYFGTVCVQNDHSDEDDDDSRLKQSTILEAGIAPVTPKT
jgi:hypothetical protein